MPAGTWQIFDLDALFALLRGGSASRADLEPLSEGLESGALVAASGAGAMAVGGDAYKPAITNTTNHVRLTLTEAQFVALLALHRERLLPRLLNEIPDNLPDFTGREAEEADLLDGLSSGTSVAVAGVTGMGGVGKSWLAYRVGAKLALRYPAAQLVIDLGGTDAVPLTPQAAMERVIRRFHPEAPLPDDAAAVANAYQAILRERSALLIFDNASNAGQVRPLLPPAPSAAIVTSRRLLDLPEVRPLRLDVLSPTEAEALLRQIMGRRAEGADLAALVTICGALPLALRVAGTFLRNRATWTVARYVERVEADRGRLRLEGVPDHDVLAVLGLSLAVLEDEDRVLAERFEMLAAFGDGFDVPAAAAVWDVTTEVAEDGLDALYGRSMVLFEPASRRYALHDLMRAVAEGAHRVAEAEENRQIREQRSPQARDRHARYYCLVLAAAAELYLARGDHLEGLRLFDLERRNIEGGWSWASNRAAEDREMAELCVRYPGVGVIVLSLRHHPRMQVEWQQTAVAAARQVGDRRGEGNSLGNLGSAHFALGNARASIGFHEDALAISRETGDRRGEGNNLGSLGNAHLALGDARASIDYYQQAQAIAREIGDRRGECNSLGGLGSAHFALGEARRSIGYYEQALFVAQEIGDRRGEGNSLGSLGLAHAALGDADAGIGYHKRALVVLREIGDRGGEGVTFGNLGNAYAALSNARAAIECHEQALAISREIGDRRGERNQLGNLGGVHAALGNVDAASGYHYGALAISREIGDRRGEGIDLGNIGKAHEALGDVRAAIGYYEQALAISREIGNRRSEASNLGNLGETQESLGDARAAIAYYEEALAISREVEDRQGEGNNLSNIGNAHFVLGDARVAIDYHEQALVIAREIGDRRGEGASLGNLGNGHAALGNPRVAIDHYEQALAISREIGDRRGEGNRLNNLGTAHFALGDACVAIGFHEQALTISREIGDRRGEANRLGNLGVVYASLGDATMAVGYHEDALAISREIGHRHGEAAQLHNIALALHELARYRDACDRLASAAAIMNDIESPSAEQARALLRQWGCEQYERGS